VAPRMASSPTSSGSVTTARVSGSSSFVSIMSPTRLAHA
jgi:hypothetical protein